MRRYLGKAKRLAKRVLFPWRRPSPRPDPGPLQLWSIGIYEGTAPHLIEPSKKVVNPVLTRESVTDVAADLVADPFLIRVDSSWYMFFEVWNRTSDRGEVALARSPDGFHWTYDRVVLREPWHLSYPYVFEWNGDFYMVPETYKNKSICLYRAASFPTKWTLVKRLLIGQPFKDTSLFRHEGRWWLFTEASLLAKSDNLKLFSAEELSGGWEEHPLSPLREADPHLSRSAGRVQWWNDRLIRFAQDCFPTYGRQVQAFEVLEVSRQGYLESPLGDPFLGPSGAGWNADGMHHVDALEISDGQWLAAVDGFRWVPRTPPR